MAMKKGENCPYYEFGFCKLGGSECKNYHAYFDPNEDPENQAGGGAELCANYIYGFCPLGPNCDKVHVRNLVN